MVYIFHKNQDFLAIYKRERPRPDGQDLLGDEIDMQEEEVSRRDRNKKSKKEVERDEKGKIKTYREREIESEDEEHSADKAKKIEDGFEGFMQYLGVALEPSEIQQRLKEIKESFKPTPSVLKVNGKVPETSVCDIYRSQKTALKAREGDTSDAEPDNSKSE